MKKKILALLLSLCLLLPVFTIAAFAEEPVNPQYQVGQAVTVSGNVNFDAPYTFVKSEYISYLCFTINDGTTTWYAAVWDTEYS